MDMNHLLKHMEERTGKQAKRNCLVKCHHDNPQISSGASFEKSERVGSLIKGLHTICMIHCNGVGHCQCEYIDITPEVTLIVRSRVVHNISHFNIGGMAP